MTRTLCLEVTNMQNRDTSFPYWPYSESTAIGSHIHHQGLFFTSKALVKILRNQISQKWGNPIPCNGGGWVNIDHILSREGAFPQDRYKKSDKFQIIAECIRSEDRKARKPRLQILAAKFDQEIHMETMTGLIAAGWSKNDIDWVRREHGGWWQPWCIRASSGHSDFGFAPAELCNSPEHVRSLGRSISRDKAISPGRHHFERYRSWRQ